ncbi:nucleoside triphosphate pyrophosphohydrolase [Nocardiopsis tropica]|uniref:MazG family protein n=1 Tax=Tsukamurella strandjordii TaxID=147577 RepID=UPI0031D4FDAD
MSGTVVLLDPALPGYVPIEAVARLSDGPVFYTEELPVRVAWNLPGARPVLDGTVPAGAVLVSSDPDHPAVAALRADGAEVIAGRRPAGLDVLDAVALIDTLRTVGPWESEQTHASLLRYLVEETYELADAVGALDAPAAGEAERAELRSELGDLLLQVIFHARIAEEAEHEPFGIDDIARTLTAKVRRRTPHLAEGSEVDVATQAQNWERQKRLEKQARGEASVLDSISLAQPALALAGKVFERLRTAGFPAELVPDEVRTVTVDPTAEDHSAELEYRGTLLAFLDRVRAAEALIASGEVDSWAFAWDNVPAGNPEGTVAR